MVLTSRRAFVKGAVASCVALANVDSRGFDGGSAAGLPNSIFAYEFGDISPEQQAGFAREYGFEEPSSIMRSKSPSGCERWTRHISNCSFFG
jgi:hypothetical protein